MNNHMIKRTALFALFNTAMLIIFFSPLKELLLSSSHNELYSHIILVPFISGYLLYMRRRELGLHAAYSYVPGALVMLTGIVLSVVGRNVRPGLSQNDYLSIMTSAAVVFLLGGFLVCYGVRAFKGALFPLLFLFFVVPVPAVIMDRLIYSLQSWSAEVSYGFFKLAGIPIVREGLVFHLSGITVEVARECSGIRSTLVLFLLGILSSALFLETWRARAVLLLLLFPLAIFKNSLRIVTLSLLGSYADKAWVETSPLHRKGGFVFFLAAMAVFGIILWLLSRWESRQNQQSAL